MVMVFVTVIWFVQADDANTDDKSSIVRIASDFFIFSPKHIDFGIVSGIYIVLNL